MDASHKKSGFAIRRQNRFVIYSESEYLLNLNYTRYFFQKGTLDSGLEGDRRTWTASASAKQAEFNNTVFNID